MSENKFKVPAKSAPAKKEVSDANQSIIIEMQEFINSLLFF